MGGVLGALEAAGLQVTLRPGDRLRVAPAERLTPALREMIRAHKGELLAACRARDHGATEGQADYPSTLTELQARGAVPEGAWSEVSAPDWEPEEAPGCPRRWFSGQGERWVSIT